MKQYLDEEPFFFTYGDGLSNINLIELLQHHKNEGKKATLTAVKPPGRYGGVRLENNYVTQFQEKPDGDKAWINGGFFVLNPSVMDFIEGDHTIWERDPLVNLSKVRELTAFRHRGFGNQWIIFEIKINLKNYGTKSKLLGKYELVQKKKFLVKF